MIILTLDKRLGCMSANLLRYLAVNSPFITSLSHLIQRQVTSEADAKEDPAVLETMFSLLI
jgi:hypothetical protein